MRVFSNTAISLDGRINTREGQFLNLGTARDHAQMSRLRSQADAVLVGGATFRNWPRPSLPVEADRHAGHAPLWNVVVTRGLQLPNLTEFVAEPRIRPLFLTRAAVVPPDFPAEYETYPGPDESLPIAWILAALQKRGVQQLLVEAGGDLLYQFLAADAVDELYVTLCRCSSADRRRGWLGGRDSWRPSCGGCSYFRAKSSGMRSFCTMQHDARRRMPSALHEQNKRTHLVLRTSCSMAVITAA